MELALSSPLHFKRQLLICVPLDLPLPGSTEFAAQSARFLADLFRVTSGRCVLLFTSYKLLDELYSRLAPNLSQMGITALKQGTLSPHVLATQFRENIHSVLFCTARFWEGIDVPTEALECLVITKLPFGVPTGLLIQARMRALARKGLNPFDELSLPSAVLRFKQHLRRLLRNKTDKAMIIILDKRVLVRTYGSKFLNALPGTSRHGASGDRHMVLKKVAEWLKQKNC